jgi:hypothetical protein
MYMGRTKHISGPWVENPWLRVSDTGKIGNSKIKEIPQGQNRLIGLNKERKRRNELQQQM